MLRPADELGPTLVGRAAAIEMREQIEEAAVAGPVVIDLSGVEVVSPSFADELFAKLPSDLLESGRVRFEGVGSGLALFAAFLRRSRIENR